MSDQVPSFSVYEFDDWREDTRRVEDWIHHKGLFKTRRQFRLAVCGSVESLYDDLAASKNWHMQWDGNHSAVMDVEGGFISIASGQKKSYTSNSFTIEAVSPERAAEIKSLLIEVIGDRVITDLMFTIEWHFAASSGHGGERLQAVNMEEMADDVLFDESYPDLKSVSGFIKGYLDAPETILVIQGPPGTGKTRLIRAIMAELSRRKGNNATALYTAERGVLERDSLFVKFISDDQEAFIMEDADHMLTPRAKGNENLHRFLAVADGVVRAQGRKIIFSTNLPNMGDLDDALVRPGRCYARIATRNLLFREAKLVVDRLTDDPLVRERAYGPLSEPKNVSLAEVYKAVYCGK